ncbi:MAG: murein biosynthesis integral membrane protein MurJ [Burkholderiales bacterium]|nr:murein biosynthesis integral membrane protein MurJ [Anaerolineae bacterium]
MTVDTLPANVQPATVEEAAAIEAARQQDETNVGVARATGVLALGNVASRVLGLAREIALTNLFGASGAVDAFNVAIIVPKALYDLLIGGHVNSALIPVLSAVAAKQGRQELWRLVSVLLSLTTVMLAVLVLVLELFASQIVGLVSGGSDAETLALAAHLLRLTAPALICLSLFAVLSGALYALRSFMWPAFAGAVFNGSIVLGTVLLAPQLQVVSIVSGASVQWALARPAAGITAAAIGWLIGSLVQLALQMPGLKGARLRLTLHWRHPAIRQIAWLYAPVMFSLIMDTLVIRTFSYNLASQTGEGGIAYMGWATTLIQFPQGLVATAISIAILPPLAAQAALTTLEGAQAFKDTLGIGLRLAITLIVPATVGLFVLATPIIDLLFEHGAFTAGDTAVTAIALRLYLVGLPFAALDLLLVYAFYARQDTLTPALIGLLSLTVYMVIAVALLPRYGLFSLMIADSMKHIVHATVSAYFLRRRTGGLGQQRLFLTSTKTGIAALAMGVVAALVLPLLARVIGTDGLLSELSLVVISGGLSAAVFLVLAVLLKIDELRWLGGLMRRRLAR